MQLPDLILPEQAASEVVVLLAEKESIPYNEAMVCILHSETFRRLMADSDLCLAPPEELLEAYLQEGC